MSTEQLLKIQSIIAPQVAKKRIDLLTQGRRVAHYTTAENALRILRSGEVWLRNVRAMNDYKEVEHGFGMMLRFFSPETAENPDLGQKQLFSALNSIHAGTVTKAIENFNGWSQHIQTQTFCTCVSEHSGSEDEIGRLSMWRGYGYAQPAVALVLNPDVFYTTGDGLGAYSSPVIYQTPEQFYDVMRGTSAAVLDNADVMEALGPDELSGWLFQMLLLYAVCQKHRGFAEEQEWRIMHIPKLHQPGQLTKATETIRGRPQLVYKLKLQSDPANGIVGASIPELLHHVIIGPTDEPWQIWEAFVALLEELGIPDAHKKVVVSDIPFRTGL